MTTEERQALKLAIDRVLRRRLSQDMICCWCRNVDAFAWLDDGPPAGRQPCCFDCLELMIERENALYANDQRRLAFQRGELERFTDQRDLMPPLWER